MFNGLSGRTLFNSPACCVTEQVLQQTAPPQPSAWWGAFVRFQDFICGVVAGSQVQLTMGLAAAPGV